MREHEIKQILQELDQQPLPSKEKVLAACEESFEKKEQPKAATVISRRIFTKHGMLRVGALAACLCLLVTGIFGGVGLLKNQFGDATAPMTQSAPDLPLDHYPNGEVDYANMSMVEYMELHPDFLSYRYMPWHEGYAFAHLEILDVKRTVECGYDYVVKCRVISDAWNVLETGSELNFLINPDADASFFKNVSEVLLRIPLEKTGFVKTADGETVEAMRRIYELRYLGCFPIEDGKVKLEKIENYLEVNNKTLAHSGNMDSSCKFSDVESIVAEGMAVETALDNLRNVYEKYQTGEYNILTVDVVSQMTYSEYCRVVAGTLTDEDWAKFDITFKIQYSKLPALYSEELSLSDGTKFEFCTRVKLSETLLERLIKETIVECEAVCTDKDGKLDTEACIKRIKEFEFDYSFRSSLGGS